MVGIDSDLRLNITAGGLGLPSDDESNYYVDLVSADTSHFSYTFGDAYDPDKFTAIAYGNYNQGAINQLLASGYAPDALINSTTRYEEFATDNASQRFVMVGITPTTANAFMEYNSPLMFSGQDLIFASSLNDVVRGFAASDTIEGNGGNDTLYGGNGTADSNDIADIISGGTDHDLIYGNGGNDTLYGGASNMSTGTGNDQFYGGLGTDSIYGQDGDDWLAGGGGLAHPHDQADQIFGGEGNDKLIGNGDNDTLIGGNDIADTGGGNDHLVGGFGNDLLYGCGGDDILIGQIGNDRMVGGAGRDSFVFVGRDGNDTIVDFDSAQDALYLSTSLGFSTASQAIAALNASAIHAPDGTIITFSSSVSLSAGNVFIADPMPFFQPLLGYE